MSVQMNWKALHDEIAQITRDAAQEYERMSDMVAWYVAERWLQCAIAKGLSHKFYVMLEVPVALLLQWHLGRPKNEMPPPEMRDVGWTWFCSTRQAKLPARPPL